MLKGVSRAALIVKWSSTVHTDCSPSLADAKTSPGSDLVQDIQESYQRLEFFSDKSVLIIIIIIGIYIAPFPFIKCSKALHIVIV